MHDLRLLRKASLLLFRSSTSLQLNPSGGYRILFQGISVVSKRILLKILKSLSPQNLQRNPRSLHQLHRGVYLQLHLCHPLMLLDPQSFVLNITWYVLQIFTFELIRNGILLKFKIDLIESVTWKHHWWPSFSFSKCQPRQCWTWLRCSRKAWYLRR